MVEVSLMLGFCTEQSKRLGIDENTELHVTPLRPLQSSYRQLLIFDLFIKDTFSDIINTASQWVVMRR